MSVPSLASNRVNALNLEIEQLTIEVNDLSAFTHQISGAIPIQEIQDLSNRIFVNENAISVLEVSNTELQDDVDVLTALVNALDVSNISGFIVLYDLSEEVWSLSGRYEQTELQIDASFGSLTTTLNDLSQFTTDLSLYIETINISQGVSIAQFNDLSQFTYDLSAYVEQISLSAGVSQSQFNDLSSFTYIIYNSQNIINNGLLTLENEVADLSARTLVVINDVSSINDGLTDLSTYVYNNDPQNSVSQAQFEDLSGFVKTNAFLTSRTITNGNYVGTFTQSGSTASFQAIDTPSIQSGTGNVVVNSNMKIDQALTLDSYIVSPPDEDGLGFTSLSDGSLIPIYFVMPEAQINVNSIVYTPNLMITNCAGVPNDSATSTQQGTYRLFGGYRDGRNWATFQPYGVISLSPIAEMRIALDKAYFSTEQHPVRVPSWYSPSYYGLLLSSQSKYINQPTITEAHIYAEITITEKDKNVYGVYSKYDFPLTQPDEEEDNIYSLFIPQKTPETKIGYSSSGGEGQVWCCNLNGNIEPGDYLHSSKIPGIAVKQEDDLKHNYTIFKSAFNCSFENDTSIYPKHIVDASGERQWRNPDNHKEGFKYEMVSYTNKVYTLKISSTFYEIVGVLRYSFDFQSHQPQLVGKTFKAMLIGGVYCN
jgi:hypothetical protein